MTRLVMTLILVMAAVGAAMADGVPIPTGCPNEQPKCIKVVAPEETQLQTGNVVVIFPADDATLQAQFNGMEELGPNCTGIVVPGDPCGTHFNQNYYQYCLSGQCAHTPDTSPCWFGNDSRPSYQTLVTPPGKWWVPMNFGDDLDSNNQAINMPRLTIPTTTTLYQLDIDGVLTKHFTDDHGVTHPTFSPHDDLLGQTALSAYVDGRNQAIIRVGLDVNGPFIKAESMEAGNYYSHTFRQAIVLDGPDGTNFTGQLRITRSGSTYTYSYSQNGGPWQQLMVRTPAWTGVPGWITASTMGVATSATNCVQVAGFEYQ